MMQDRGLERKAGARGGMTLTEILVGMVIFVMIFGGMSVILIGAGRYWRVNQARVTLEQNLRQAMARISSELRQTKTVLGGISLPVGASAGQLRFCVCLKEDQGSGPVAVGSSEIEYRLGGADGTELQRVQDNQVTVIARDIKTAEFSRPQVSRVDISLTGERPSAGNIMLEKQLNFSIHMRN